MRPTPRQIWFQARPSLAQSSPRPLLKQRSESCPASGAPVKDRQRLRHQHRLVRSVAVLARPPQSVRPPNVRPRSAQRRIVRLRRVQPRLGLPQNELLRIVHQRSARPARAPALPGNRQHRAPSRQPPALRAHPRASPQLGRRLLPRRRLRAQRPSAARPSQPRQRVHARHRLAVAAQRGAVVDVVVRLAAARPPAAPTPKRRDPRTEGAQAAHIALREH